MIEHARGEPQGSGNVLGLQVGELFEDLLGGEPGGQEIQHVGHPDAQAPDAGPAPALLGIDGDAAQLASHELTRLGCRLATTVDALAFRGAISIRQRLVQISGYHVFAYAAELI